MFPNLPPYTEQTDQGRELAAQLGAAGGPLDAADNLTDPLQSIINQPVFSPNNGDNASMTAGVTFIGQFLDHDITFDRRSQIAALADPEKTANFRSAAFDLDSLYGEGPQQSPELYDQTGPTVKMRVEAIPGSENVSRGGATRYDVPRDTLGNAIIGDSRNDEHVILSQFHLAMLRFHNTVTDRLQTLDTNQTRSPRELFSEAQRIVRWHYQWIILNEFLPLTIGQERVNEILQQGPRFFQTPTASGNGARGRSGRGQNGGRSQAQQTSPQLPIEFSVAAYRFGHSQVRPSYRLNFGADDDSQVFAFVLDNRVDPNATDPDDLRGGKRAPRRFVDWQTFFDFGDGSVRNNKLIDIKISSNLFDLPGSNVPAPGLPTDGVVSLASRNLIRHLNFGLPSGQSVAQTMGLPSLSELDLNELAPFGMAQSTPLWVYILKEAEIMEGGTRLGPVGARIVGEVFIGLLQADQEAYLAASPNWRPTLPSASGEGQFTIVDLLNLADVVPPLE
ncbi:MAG: heme peroxidase family protein [Burkholderiaceae bacterium]